MSKNPDNSQKIVFVDGENFRQRVVELLCHQGVIADKNAYFSLDVRGLIEDVLGISGVEINYYASEIKTPKGYTPSVRIQRQVDGIKENSRRWVAMLKRQDINYIKAGNLKVKEGKECNHCHKTQEILQEKGVDVRMALDMLELSYKTKNTSVVSVSSDTDLCPSYHKIRKRKRKTTYICFSDSVNRAVAAATDETITITPQKVMSYFQEELA
jgi:putative uncharacterized protein (fragment)